MKVKCIRILAGGAHGGRELGKSRTITVGKQYVVLAVSGLPRRGVSYTLLRDDLNPGLEATMDWTSEMFEITSSKIPTSWKIADVYGDGVLISLRPDAWELGFQERTDDAAHEIFERDVRQLYEEEGEPHPF